MTEPRPFEIPRDAMAEIDTALKAIGKAAAALRLTADERDAFVRRIGTIEDALTLDLCTTCCGCNEMIAPGDQHASLGEDATICEDCAPTVAEELAELKAMDVLDDEPVTELGETKAECRAHLASHDPASKRLTTW